MIFRIEIFTVPAGREEDLRADAPQTRHRWQSDSIEWSSTWVRIGGVFSEVLTPASVSKRVRLGASWDGSVCALRRVPCSETEPLFVSR